MDGSAPWRHNLAAVTDGLGLLKLYGPRGVVLEGLTVAGDLRRRLRGLRGRLRLEPSEGLLLWPCRQVHTFGMRFAIDTVFCDRDLRVVHQETIRPRRVSRYVRRAACCIEMVPGRAAEYGLGVGTQLALGMSPGPAP